MKKMQFSKLILGAVMFLFFAGAIFGGFVVTNDSSGLSALLTYIGAPTATAIGFYAWKSKAENVIKITQAVENNKKLPEKTKRQLISGIAKTLNELETEEYNNADE